MLPDRLPDGQLIRAFLLALAAIDASVHGFHGPCPGLAENSFRRQALQKRYNVTIAGGLGDFKGRVWRIGLMGNSSRPQNVLLLLAALERLIAEARAS